MVVHKTDFETEIFLWMSGLPTLCDDISRNREINVYSMCHEKKVLLICKIDFLCNYFSFIISIIEKNGNP